MTANVSFVCLFGLLFVDTKHHFIIQGNLEEKADGISMSSNEDQNELRPSKYAQTDDLE